MKEATLDLRTPGVVESLVSEDRTPLIVGGLDTETAFVLVPASPLREGDRWWESMGHTFSVSRLGSTRLEQVDQYEVGVDIALDISRRIQEARELAV